ncbi:amidohydrolase family protein [Gordonia hydrophobica]|uniref:Amidohydrolase family protein n=1 Tax=Gordonia hydrophobica TaxID=40516 RepID=A0ABZ2U783_9ACTN|nr:amidohydrolase family protein [Gordonia hydrophobica]MBM7365480.1 putative TIM-barrel fold metal-dependent hydrolase [Gordonia hydrophobica]
MTTLEGLLPGIVDAHVHYFNPTRSSWALARFERLSRLPMQRFVPPPILWFASKFSTGDDGRLGLDPSVLRSAYELASYAHDADALYAVAGVGVRSVVSIEAHWRAMKSPEALMDSSYDELKYVLALPHGRSGPDLGATVSAVDPRHRDFARQLDRQLALSDKIRGVRFKWAQHPDPEIPDWCDEPDAVASTSFLNGFEAIAERDLTFVSFAYSHQLGQLDMLARRFPETTIVIEHLGMPAGVFGPTGARTGMTAAARAEILGLWRERIAMIAQRPNVVIKVSGLGLSNLGYGLETAGNIGTRAVLADMIGPLVLHAVDRFGPDRVVFGSDSPIDRPNSTIDMSVGALLDVLGDRGPYLLQQLFARNAERIYGVPAPPSN